MKEKEPKIDATNLLSIDHYNSSDKRVVRGSIHNTIMMELQQKIKAHSDSLRQVKNKHLEGENGGRRATDSSENLSN